METVFGLVITFVMLMFSIYKGIFIGYPLLISFFIFVTIVYFVKSIFSVYSTLFNDSIISIFLIFFSYKHTMRIPIKSVI